MRIETEHNHHICLHCNLRPRVRFAFNCRRNEPINNYNHIKHDERYTKPKPNQAKPNQSKLCTCTSLTFASRDPRLSTGRLWCSAHAPTWLPRGRLWKYSALSFSVTCEQQSSTTTTSFPYEE